MYVTVRLYEPGSVHVESGRPARSSFVFFLDAEIWKKSECEKFFFLSVITAFAEVFAFLLFLGVFHLQKPVERSSVPSSHQ